MFKYYNSNLIISNRSYKISDICNVFKEQKLNNKTVRRFIKKDKLEAFEYKGEFYIHGGTLKAFLKERKSNNKRTLEFDEFRCGKCKKIAQPFENTITKLTIGRNNCILAFGLCPYCSHEKSRPYKRDFESKIREIFRIEQDDLIALYNPLASTISTQANLTQKDTQSGSIKKDNKRKTIKIKYNKNNEVIKYQFFKELKYSGINGKKPRDDQTISQCILAIHEFEIATNFKDFKQFNQDIAIEFKEHLNNKKNKRTGENISKSFYIHALNHLKEVFEWLISFKEYSHIKKSDINFLQPTQNDINTALSTKFQPSYLISDILSTIRNMPNSTLIEMRDKAMISLCLLTTPRISALRTAKICSINFLKEYTAWVFEQDPKKGVATKNRKYILSFFMGHSQDIIDNILNWHQYLIENGFKDNDPLFPQFNPTFTKEGNNTLEITHNMIKDDGWIRINIFKKTFQNNNLKYIHPHNFRHSVARAMKKLPNAIYLSIALAENDGQKNGMSVLHSSYGGDYMNERAELMKSFKLE